MRPITFAALLALAATATACLEPLTPSNGRYGLVSVATYSDGAAGYVMAPHAVFYGQTDYSFEAPPADTCFLARYSASGSVVSGIVTLDAGQYLIARTGARVDSLQALLEYGLRVYRPVQSGGWPFTPGDSLRIDVPGSLREFPSSTVSARTAEAFTASAVDVPAAGTDIVLNWTPAPEPGSLMTYSLRYSNFMSSNGVENEQVFCSLVDDGTATIPAGLLTGWIEAVNGVRSWRAARLRSQEVVLDARTRLAILSSFGQPLDSKLQ